MESCLAARPNAWVRKTRQSMDSLTIEQMIRAGLPGADVQVSGEDGVHFEATVVCEEFTGKSTLQRHRMVYETLGSAMGNEIHALGLTTHAPGEKA